MTETVGIVGLGLIGGSLAHRLRESDIRVLAVDTRQDLQTVLRGHSIEQVSIHEAVAGSDVLFLCVPLVEILGYVKKIGELAYLRTGMSPLIVTDVGSVKGEIQKYMTLLRDVPGLKFIPGHPMAGTEHTGFENAHSVLFEGATWVLCPEVGVSRELATLSELLCMVGARITCLEADVHDRSVAVISHLPHVLAAAEVLSVPSVSERVAFRLASSSFRDVTRVASSSPVLSASLIQGNSSNVAFVLDEVISRLIDFQEALAGESDSESTVRELFEAANARRDIYLSMRGTFNPVSISLPIDELVSWMLKVCADGGVIHSLTMSSDVCRVVYESAV
jgi:prephenate dehydrogenase